MYKCPKCGAEVTPGQDVCVCGTKITWDAPQEQLTKTHNRSKMANTLQVVAILLMVFGGLIGLVLLTISATAGIVVLASSIISGVFILVFSEIIQRLTETVQLLQDIKNKLK